GPLRGGALPAGQGRDPGHAGELRVKVHLGVVAGLHGGEVAGQQVDGRALALDHVAGRGLLGEHRAVGRQQRGGGAEALVPAVDVEHLDEAEGLGREGEGGVL
ncbi:MAG: hypothetical protein ACK559_11150, partial [bacterium]